MLSRSLVHRKSLEVINRQFHLPDYFLSKRSRVLENLGAGSVNLSKEEFDEINQLVEGLNVHGLRYNAAMQGSLWR